MAARGRALGRRSRPRRKSPRSSSTRGAQCRLHQRSAAPICGSPRRSGRTFLVHHSSRGSTFDRRRPDPDQRSRHPELRGRCFAPAAPHGPFGLFGPGDFRPRACLQRRRRLRKAALRIDRQARTDRGRRPVRDRNQDQSGRQNADLLRQWRRHDPRRPDERSRHNRPLRHQGVPRQAGGRRREQGSLRPHRAIRHRLLLVIHGGGRRHRRHPSRRKQRGLALVVRRQRRVHHRAAPPRKRAEARDVRHPSSE